MSPAVLDVPAALGDYMLKGWVLTNTPCTNPGCSIPLMRSPSSVNPPKQFCVKCDGTPNDQDDAPMPHVSKSSTPAANQHHDSPPQSPAFELPQETEKSRLRREQSDRASAEIGKRLLSGWAMLADECPSDGCYGVPLVRPPKTATHNDTRMECVICGKSFITELDAMGREQLRIVNDRQKAGNSQVAGKFQSSQVEYHKSEEELGADATIPKAILPLAKPMPLPTELNHTSAPTMFRDMEPHLSNSLKESAYALQQSLDALTARLTNLTSSSFALDPIAISQTAEAIGNVAQALWQVRKLQI